MGEQHSLWAPSTKARQAGVHRQDTSAPNECRASLRIFSPLPSLALRLAQSGIDAEQGAVSLPLQHRLLSLHWPSHCLLFVPPATVAVLLRRVRLDSMQSVHQQRGRHLLLPQLSV